MTTPLRFVTGQYRLTTPTDGFLIRTSVGDGRGHYRHLPWSKHCTPYGAFPTHNHDRDRYRAVYRRRLDGIGIDDVVAELERLHTERGARESRAVLGCFCDLTKGGWCHREMLAAWLTEQLGYDIDELHPATPTTTVHAQDSLFD